MIRLILCLSLAFVLSQISPSPNRADSDQDGRQVTVPIEEKMIDLPASPGGRRVERMRKDHQIGFGADDRQPMLSRRYPWNAIGRVELSTGGFCTGALVGEDLLLTNAHCVLNEGRLVKVKFKPNYMNGSAPEEVDSVWVWYGTSNPDLHRASDWALVRLERPIGRTYGWFGLSTRTDEWLLKRSVTFAGYSTFANEQREIFKGGETAGVDIGCSITKAENGIVSNSCDTGKGSSGGPVFIWQNNLPYIIALNAAEYRDNLPDSFWKDQKYAIDFGNVSVPTRNFFRAMPNQNSQ